MRKEIQIAVLAVVVILTASAKVLPGQDDKARFLLEYLRIKYQNRDFNTFIYVAAKNQKLYLISDGKVEVSYSVSTGKEGVGGKIGSNKTPEGLHFVKEMVGSELVENEIIKKKVPTGKTATPILDAKTDGRDLITSRVMHLKGLEEGVNLGEGFDSYRRGIFIHGTHEEGLIGKPVSRGCIRMRNKDVIDLYSRIEVGTFVVILNN
ncbi:MAG TPA: L,D-transpeptidase [Cryomorphaceae bacterium]|nr:L,D-transpeptidase [Cryomorphaceae bacterium]